MTSMARSAASSPSVASSLPIGVAERIGQRRAVDLRGERAEAVLVRHGLRGQRHRQVGAAVVGVVERDDRLLARCTSRAILIAFSTASAPELNSAERFSSLAGGEPVELLRRPRRSPRTA